MRYLLIALCALALLWSSQGRAETIPATPTVKGGTCNGFVGAWGHAARAGGWTPEECLAVRNDGVNSKYHKYISGTWTGGFLYATIWQATNVYPTTCPGGNGGCVVLTGIQLLGSQTTYYSCPTTGGWTLSGTNCTRPDCPAGQTRNAQDVCESVCIGQTGQSMAGYVPLNASGSASVICSGGCEMIVNTASTGYGAVVGGVVTSYAKGSWSYSGAACTSGNTSPASSLPANTCGAGQYAGTVNGKFTCVNSTTGATESSLAPPTSTSTTTTSTQDNGDGTSTRTETTTGSDGRTSTTTTTINNATGQPVSSTTTADKTAEERDREGAQAEAEKGLAQLNQPRPAGENTVAGLGLPTSNPYSPFSTSGASALLPTNSGNCVTMDVSLPYMGQMTINPCPVVQAVRPLVDGLILALAAIGAVLAIFGAKRSEA